MAITNCDICGKQVTEDQLKFSLELLGHPMSYRCHTICLECGAGIVPEARKPLPLDLTIAGEVAMHEEEWYGTARRHFLHLYDCVKSFPKTEYQEALIDILRAVERLMEIHKASLTTKRAPPSFEKNVHRWLSLGLARLGLSVKSAKDDTPVR